MCLHRRLLRVQLPQEMLAHGADPDLAFQLAPPSAAAHAASSKCMTPGQQQQATSAPGATTAAMRSTHACIGNHPTAPN
jgi:hypothetical protein